MLWRRYWKGCDEGEDWAQEVDGLWTRRKGWSGLCEEGCVKRLVVGHDVDMKQMVAMR